MIRRVAGLLAVAAILCALAAQQAGATSYNQTDCAVNGGTVKPIHLRACNAYSAHIWDLAVKVWPRMQGTSWACTIIGPRGLRCDLQVVKRLGGIVHMRHTVTWRVAGGVCVARVGDFEGRWPFAPDGCIVVLLDGVGGVA